MSGEWFRVFQRNAVPLSSWVKHSKKNSQHRESVVKCGYSGDGWWVAGMVVNTEKDHEHLNPLRMKHRLLYLKTQSVPRSKHFSSRL